MLLAQYQKYQREMELFVKVVETGYVNGRTGKHYTLFDAPKKGIGSVKPLDKREELNALKEMFSKGKESERKQASTR